MLAAGITVGLGSDSMASNNRMDILGEARLALLTQRARLGSCETPESVDVLELATIGGAKAIGVEAVVGSLEPGKQADLAAFPIDGAGPIQDPRTAAIFSIAGARARFVSVAGKPLVQDGALLAPRAGLEQRVQSLADLLSKWLADGGEMAGVV
jgi:5-methylthioadenosine/S-adenosylhomocysteine deaminase